MKLIFIYGPPAAGKLTVAQELSAITGYSVFPNHEIVGLVTTLFPYSDDTLSEARKNLTRSIRLQIYKKAAESNISFITTFGMAGANYFDFFIEIKHEVELAGGEVCFIQLICTKDELLNRVTSENRKGKKIDSQEYLLELLDRNPGIFDKFPDVEHLSFENSNLPAQIVSERIAKYYELLP